MFHSYRLLGDDGSPNTGFCSIKHTELQDASGVSAGAFANAIDECCRMQYIDARRDRGRGEYRIRLSENPTSNPKQFAGFFSGAGRWSPIPYQFFTHIIPNYTLAEIRVAGAVLRHTVGYEQKLGIRRKNHPLSVDYLQRYTRISDRKTLTDAIAKLEEGNVIECVERGVFHPDLKQRRPAIYGPKWNTPGESTESKADASKSQPVVVFQNPNQRDLSKSQPETSKSQPVDSLKIPTNINPVPSEETNNSKTTVVVPDDLVRLLVHHGVGEHCAKKLCASRDRQKIEQQIEWLSHRDPEDAGAMLRRAIEQDWGVPPSLKVQENRQRSQQDAASRKRQQLVQLQKHEAAVQEAERQKRIEHQLWLSHWSALPIEHKRAYYQAVERTANSFTRRLLQNKNYENPPLVVLQAMAVDLEPASSHASCP